jgi:hypothetical protein
MVARRVLGVLALALAAEPAAAQTIPLAEAVQPGDCFHIQLAMQLKGQMRVQKDGDPASLPLEASATHDFSERVLAVGKGGVIDRAARVYETARASILVNGDRLERSLRAERRLLAAQRTREGVLVYAPNGALLREEMELASEHLDTLSLPGLLPGGEVAVGATWKPADVAVQGLCGFEGLTGHTLQGKLDAVQDGVAVFSVAGTAGGIDGGALVKLTITASGRFDLKAKRIVALEWKQKDERGQGPVSPATNVETSWKVTRQVVPQPAALSDVALVGVPDKDVPESLLRLEYREPKGRFGLLLAREWQTVAQTAEHLVLRLMDRGDFVAQATLTTWTPAGKGKHLSPDEFKKAMGNTPGWEPDRELQAGEVPSDGRWVYRLSVLGKLEGVEVLQNFYLIAAPEGEQVVVAVTLAPKQAEKLGARDLALVAGLEVPAARK